MFQQICAGLHTEGCNVSADGRVDALPGESAEVYARWDRQTDGHVTDALLLFARQSRQPINTRLVGWSLTALLTQDKYYAIRQVGV